MIQEQLTRIEELAKVDPIVRASIDRRDHSFKDERIKGAFLIAPALGRLFTEAGLSTVNIPVAIVASHADKVTPLAIDAQPYAQSIPSATLTAVPGDVSHFAFGNECTPAGKRTLSICKDGDGVDRAQLHRWVGAHA
jgi:predicted dienelactone hydrolase